MGLLYAGAFLIGVAMMVGWTTRGAKGLSQSVRINVAIGAFVFGVSLVTVWALTS